MANQVLWKAPTARTSGISADTIAAGSNEIGSEIDNEVNLDRYMSAELTWTCATASTENEVMELYILYSLDGTNYEDGSDSVDPKKSPVAVFVDDGGTAVQKQTVSGISIKPFAFKALLKSELTNSAASVTLDIETYNEEVQ